MLFRCTCIAVVVAACGDSSSGPPDAFVDTGPCWPVDTSVAGGAIALGTGDPYAALPDEVRLQYYQRGDLFFVSLTARVSAIEPGNMNDVGDPINPRTRFRGYWVDTGEMITPLPRTCPIRIGYRPSAEPGTFELSGKSGVEFPSGLKGSQLFGRQIRLEVEIIDSAHSYARDEKIVTVREPSAPM
jgi:hypothetical protein